LGIGKKLVQTAQTEYVKTYYCMLII